MKSLAENISLLSGSALLAASAQTHVIQNAAELERRAAGWRALERCAVNPMQHFIWAQAFAQTYEQTTPLQVLTVGPAHAPRAIAPLVRRWAGGPRLELLGVQELNEPQQLLFADEAALAELAEALTRQSCGLWFERLPAEGPVVAALRRAFDQRGLVHHSAAPCYPRIPLDASWCEPESHFNAGRRSDFRRAERKAAEQGAVSFEILAPAPEQVAALLEEAYAVEAACWKGAEKSALACDEQRGAFFRRYARAAAERGILRLCFMRIDGRAVAMQLAVECHDRFWLFKIGYDEAFARCSPGTLLMLHTLRYAAERGLQAYEFLGSAQPWTKMWTETRQQCVSLRAYPLRPAAMLTLGHDALAHAGAAIQKRWAKRREA